MGKNNSKFGEVILTFYQLFLYLKQSKLSDSLIVKNKLDLEVVFENYMKFSKINLKNFLDLIYEKEGYAFLDFKGNICKILSFKIFLVYMDSYSSQNIFECENFENKNIFDLMTDYSKFIIRKNFDQLYDYKNVDCRLREFIFTIDLRNLRKSSTEFELRNEPMGASTFNKKIIEIFNNSKTLHGRISTILLPSTKKQETPSACILLEFKLCKRRQNFDDFLWKQIFN